MRATRALCKSVTNGSDLQVLDSRAPSISVIIDLAGATSPQREKREREERGRERERGLRSEGQYYLKSSSPREQETVFLAAIKFVSKE